MNVLKNYMDGQTSVCSWLSGTLIVEVKRQVCLCVLDNRIINTDKMAPGKNSSYLGKQYRGNFKGSTENALF